MRTAKEEFIELARKKAGCEKFDKIKDEVSLYYDLNCNIKSEQCNEKQLAEYEFFRFQNMTDSVFIDFFTEYKKRQNLLTLKSIADNLAVERMKHGALISREEYSVRCNEIMDFAKDLIFHEKCRAWTERTVKDAINSLKYASGQSDTVNKNVLIAGGNLL